MARESARRGMVTGQIDTCISVKYREFDPMGPFSVMLEHAC